MTAAATLRRGGVLAFGSAAAMLVAVLTYPGEAAAPPATDLRDAASFASIRSADARSQALFTEAAKVIMHPR
jgi:hypothetical protein